MAGSTFVPVCAFKFSRHPTFLLASTPPPPAPRSSWVWALSGGACSLMKEGDSPPRGRGKDGKHLPTYLLPRTSHPETGRPKQQELVISYLLGSAGFSSAPCELTWGHGVVGGWWALIIRDISSGWNVPDGLTHSRAGLATLRQAPGHVADLSSGGAHGARVRAAALRGAGGLEADGRAAIRLKPGLGARVRPRPCCTVWVRVGLGQPRFKRWGGRDPPVSRRVTDHTVGVRSGEGTVAEGPRRHPRSLSQYVLLE